MESQNDNVPPFALWSYCLHYVPPFSLQCCHFQVLFDIIYNNSQFSFSFSLLVACIMRGN